MNRRCKSCMFRAADGAGSCGGCAYIQITGKSRLKEVYKRLGVNWMTDAVRVAMRPENCMCYREGARVEIEDGRRITLNGSTPVPEAAERIATAPAGPRNDGKAAGKADAGKAARKPREPAPPKMDREAALRLYREGLSDRQIGERLGVTATTVCTWRNREKLPANYSPGKGSAAMKALWQEGKCDREIAEELGVRLKTVKAWRSKKGLPRRPDPREKLQEDVMRQRLALYGRGCTDEEIARIQGVKRSTVTAWRWRLHLPEHTVRGTIVPKEAEALRLYREGRTDREISDALGVPIGTVRSWRDRRRLACNQDRKGHAATWEDEGRRLLAEGRTDREIAEIVGVCRSTFSQWRRRRGLPINHERSGPKEPRKKAANDL